MSFIDIFYIFIFYSFLGWALETTFVSLRQRRFSNTGLLDGPFSPIYGFGTLLIIFFVSPFQSNLLYFLTAAIIITSIFEYFSSLFFEKVFKINWWNYSKQPFNLHGRICLETSLYWGFLAILVLTFIHPKAQLLVAAIPHNLGYYGLVLLIFYFFIDISNSFQAIFKFKSNSWS